MRLKNSRYRPGRGWAMMRGGQDPRRPGWAMRQGGEGEKRGPGPGKGGRDVGGAREEKGSGREGVVSGGPALRACLQRRKKSGPP